MTVRARSARPRAGPCRRTGARNSPGPPRCSLARTSRAAATTAGQRTPSPGSRSNTSRSGCSGSSMRAPQGWNSSAFICTRSSTPSIESTYRYCSRAALLFQRDRMHVLAEAAGMVLLEEAFALAPSGQRSSDSGRSREFRQQPSRHAAVVVGDVALGVGRAFEHDALGMGDPRIALCRCLFHPAVPSSCTGRPDIRRTSCPRAGA